MKKLLKYISLACVGAISLNSCSDDDDLTLLNPAEFIAPKITDTVTAITLSEDEQTAVAHTFQWEAASYGISTTPKYSLELVKEGDSFDNATVITSTLDNTYAITGKDLNEKLIELGLEPLTVAKVSYRVVASLGTASTHPIVSNVRTIEVTPYPTDLSTPWGLIGSFSGWGSEPDTPFWKTETPNVLVAYVGLTAGDEIKIRKDSDWAVNYGGANGILTAGGDNITITETAHYKILFNTVALTYTLEKFQWGLVGDATLNGWTGPDADVLKYDGTTDTWYARVTFTSGEFKIRQNNAWDKSYGLGNAPGTLTDDNGGNIPVTAGTYNLVANFNNLTYSLTPVQ